MPDFALKFTAILYDSESVKRHAVLLAIFTVVCPAADPVRSQQVT